MTPSNIPVFIRMPWKKNERNWEKEYGLRDLVCPPSKMKATALIDNLDGGETVIILGDTASLKSVAQELKTRGIKPCFKQGGGIYINHYEITWV